MDVSTKGPQFSARLSVSPRPRDRDNENSEKRQTFGADFCRTFRIVSARRMRLSKNILKYLAYLLEYIWTFLTRQADDPIQLCAKALARRGGKHLPFADGGMGARFANLRNRKKPPEL